MKTQVVKTFSDNSILASNSDGGTFSRNPSTEQYNEVGIDVGPVEVEGSVSVEESKTAKLCCMELKKRGRDLCRNRFQKKNWERTFPILKWSKEYTLQKLVSDFIAGMTVGLTILPQGLAYATIAGLPPIVTKQT
ncbi:unnamed protein product [Orchesella dallaii]|uniref:SLC26A/SulP transporter domain-containing protein n=1 Tax=Orchesella dallaii TaxID=48710 RepID=A0ABP1PQQ4_9HEXA